MSGLLRYFCHQCNATCVPVAPDFVCPTCNEGFIEPMRVAPLSRPPPGMFPLFQGQEPMPVGGTTQGGRDAMNQIMRQMMEVVQAGAQRHHAPGAQPGGAPTVPTGSSSSSTNGYSSSQNSSPTPNNDTASRVGGHSHRIHSSNISPNSTGMAQQGGTGRLRFVLGDGLHQHGPDGNTDVPTLLNMIMQGLGSGGSPQMVGNPGDYAWGPTGLDNIISQLIGQLDGSGPPPALEDSIENLPDVYVPKKHIDNKLDCTVCQEYFTEDEKVKELPCAHYFHVECIVPWLKLHNSCPICRVSIDEGNTPADVSMPDERDTDCLAVLEDRTEIQLAAATSGPLHEDDLD